MGCSPIKINNTNKNNNVQSKISTQLPEQEQVSHIPPATSNSTKPLLTDFSITTGTFISQKCMDPSLKYTQGKSVGQGGFGEVFQVTDHDTRNNFAMKEIQDNSEGQMEIEILKSLNHPNIMKMYEYYKFNGHLYIISELLEGGKLLDLLNETHGFSDREAANVMIQLFSAVEYLHNKNIIHRDIKLDNILLINKSDSFKDYLNIKLIDFGTSKYLGKGETDKEQAGTLNYTAPEMLKQKPYDKKVDIWSCGVVMFLMLGSYYPFGNQQDGDADEDIKQNIMNGEIDFNKGNFTPEARDLIEKILVVEPKKRITVKDAIKHKWFQKYRTKILENEENKHKIMNILSKYENNISNYSVTNKLSQVCLVYVSYFHISNNDIFNLIQLFNVFNKSCDGLLKKEELVEGLSLIMNENEARNMVNNAKIKEEIEFDEFVRILIDKKEIFKEKNLQSAFDFFDSKKVKKITEEDIKEVLKSGVKTPEQVDWKGILKIEGELEYKDFCNVIQCGVKQT